MSTVGPWRPDAPGDSSGSRRRPIFRRRSSGRGGDTTLESPMVRGRLAARVRIAEGVVIFMVTLLLFGFWRLQVVHAAHYMELAENNRRRNLVVRAPRGLITDRNGLLLAANRPAFNVAIVREELTEGDATLEWLAPILGRAPEELRERLDRRQQGIPVFQPVVIADDIDQAMVAAIEARSLEHPGVIVQAEHKRQYPKGLVAAHVLGQVGEINRAQLDAWEPGRYRAGDIVGQNGVERVYNSALAGRAGDEQVQVNSAGRTMRVVNQVPPQPGDRLTLTIDLPLQQHAEALLEGRAGAIVALDVKTGGVLALASAPTYDPNMFARRIATGEWQALMNDPANPLQNRALQSSYPPGSTFKLLTAIAGLENGAITPETTVTCNGGGTYFGQYRRCNAVHGTVNLESAIGRSCNVYFYNIGEKIGREAILEVAQRYGFGSPTGIDLLDEGSGILPTDEWVEQRPGEDRGNWWPGETIGLAIGQGPIDVTPLQLAHMVATLASGTSITPHLVMAEEDPAGRPVPVPRPETIDVHLNPLHQQAILRGMSAAVNHRAPWMGTAWRARSLDVEIGGKTGSAQVASLEASGPSATRPEELQTHAWFVGVAPIDDPQVAIAVFIEHGGGGGAAAAPVGGELLASYFARRAEADQ
jgi:penicillin-binding protein 2